MREIPDGRLEAGLRRAYAGRDCPANERILELAQGELEEAATAKLIEHLQSCAACAAELELARLFAKPVEPTERRDVDFIVGRLRAATANRTAKSVSTVSQPKDTVRPSAFARPRSLRAWQLAAAATVVLGIGFVIREASLGPPDLKPPTAGRVVRGATVEALFPIGRLDEMPRQLSWAPVDGAGSFNVSLETVDGSVLWEESVTRNAAAIPEEIRTDLHVAVVYSWSVEAIGEGGARLAWSGLVEWMVEPKPPEDDRPRTEPR